ncbi:hypothetical protein OA955_01815 [Candidatus Marinimicrobia bacterium]|nr:hypothetical protein [Candidatus Neomarinimicrobiota bacterium]
MKYPRLAFDKDKKLQKRLKVKVLFPSPIAKDIKSTSFGTGKNESSKKDITLRIADRKG